MIVSWNSGHDLVDCIESLHAHPPSAPWEVIVVDNGSTDNSIVAVRSRFPDARVVENLHNRGLAAANNQGIVASRAPFVLISNPDVLYGVGVVDELLRLLRQRERAAFAVANLRYPDGRLQTSVGALPSMTEALLGRRLRWRNKPSGMWWHGWAHDTERPVGHGAEACYLVRREALAQIGLQDERFVLDWEGVDWSARAWATGWEVWFCPAATVVHLEGASRNQVPTRLIVSSHRGMYLYLSRRIRPTGRPLLAAVVIARALVKLALNAISLRVSRENPAGFKDSRD